ncbi:MAG TPA: agmatine deiminase family protein [Bacteroidota bacterium]|nr:agmatine deiminase family protein [Bacteroidota bacterium]
MKFSPATSFRLPAEWEPHRSTIICWPHQKEDWPGKFAPIPWVYVEILKHLAQSELVRVIVQAEQDVSRVHKLLERAHGEIENIEFIIAKTDRSWMRDTTPAFVKNQEGATIGIPFQFNGWAKYSNWKKDRKIPQILSKVLDVPFVPPIYQKHEFILEGGAIDSNGQGTLLATEECLLDEQTQVRNAGFTRADYEAVFRQYLGVQKTIWLKNGIAGDDTHGHIDDVCRFVNHNTLVLCREKNTSEINFSSTEKNFERLQGTTLADGSNVNVVSLPMPAPLYFENLRLPASYANFYIANTVVLVPTFNDPNDRQALGMISEFFPERTVVGIHATDLVWGLGTLHCLAHEEPA